MDYGQTGSNTVSPDGEALSRFPTEGLSYFTQLRTLL
jgi:hypothetical protein